MIKQLYSKVKFYIYTHFNVKTILFQTIQFSISTQFKYETVLFHP